MSEKLPGRKEVKEMYEVSDKVVAERLEAVRTEESALKEKIRELKVQLEPLQKEIDQLQSSKQDLEALKDQEEVWTQVAVMRDYAAAVESNVQENIQKALEEVDKCIDNELAKIPSDGDPFPSAVTQLDPSNYDTKELSSLSLEEKDFIHRRVKGVLRLWAEGKIGYRQFLELRELKVNPKSGDDPYLDWREKPGLQESSIVPLAQYSPVLEDRVREGAYDEIDRSEWYKPHTKIPQRIRSPRVPVPAEHIFRGLVRGFNPTHYNSPEWKGRLVDVQNNEPVLYSGNEAEDLWGHNPNIHADEGLRRYGVKFYMDEEDKVGEE